MRTPGFPGSVTAWAALTALLFPLSIHVAHAKAARTPEQETLAIASRLKPIPDDDWKNIAGAHVSEKYSIAKGDTLYDISKRLFGDGKYWPKVWALNNDTITNPHLIRPGNTIAFLPGTGTSLPAVSVQQTSAAEPANPEPPKSVGDMTADPTKAPADAPAGAAASTGASASSPSSKVSKEWRDLPPQRWELVNTQLPPEVDPLGFDRRSRISFKKPKGTELTLIAASDKLPVLGQVVGSRAENESLLIRDAVYIHAEEDIQIGETYAVVGIPAVLKSRRSDRTGYAYHILNRVKIIGARDNLFIGQLDGGFDGVPRGSALIPNPARIPLMEPVAGPNPIQGTVMVDSSESTTQSAQFHQVFIDRGTDDGVKPGMVFRSYTHYDPMDERKITSADFLIAADIMVIQASERFCLGIVVNSPNLLQAQTPVVLLTDVSDLSKNLGFQALSPNDKAKDKELDDLDKIDGGGGLKGNEKKELQQLEQWKGNPAPSGAPSAEPSSSPSPGDKEPPPGPETAPPPPPAPGGEAAPPPPPGEGDSVPPPPPAPGGESAAPPRGPEAPPAAGDSAPPPPPPPAAADSAAPPPPPAAADSAAPPPPPAAGDSVAPPPPPPAAAPPANKGGGDESKALDNLLNQ